MPRVESSVIPYRHKPSSNSKFAPIISELRSNRERYKNVSKRDLRATSAVPYLDDLLTVPPQFRAAQNRILEHAETLLTHKSSVYTDNKFLKKYIPVRAAHIHHACFLRGQTFSEELRSQTKRCLYFELNLYSKGEFENAEALINVNKIFKTTKPAYDICSHGALFKYEYHIDADNRIIMRLPATQYRFPNGKIYELLAKVDATHAAQLSKIMKRSIKAGNCLVGSGGNGKIRFAFDPESKEYFAAKQFNREISAQREIKIQKLLPDNGSFVKMIDYLYIHRNDKFVKSEIIYPLMKGGDLYSYIQQHCQKLNLSSSKDNTRMRVLAFDLIKSVSDLHKLNIYHQDIKSDNFLLDANDHLLLNDFELSHHVDGSPINRIGTHGYLPWNYNQNGYTMLFHDNVSLGLTLLAVVKGKEIYSMKKQCQILIGNNRITLSFLRDKHGDLLFEGIDRAGLNIDFDTYDTIFEVIAGLLDRNPATQLRATEAVNLPFFSDLWD